MDYIIVIITKDIMIIIRVILMVNDNYHGPSPIDSYHICHSKQIEDIMCCSPSSMGVT